MAVETATANGREEPQGTPESGEAPAGGEGQAPRPEWLPEKFKTPEDFVKSYSELEKKLGSGESAGEPEGKPEEENPAGDPPASEEAARVAAENAGVDFDALTSEFNESGELSAETYQALEAKGISKQVVDNYIAGQNAVAEQIAGKIAEQFGGPDVVKAVTEWAGANLTDAEIEAYNQIQATKNPEAIKMAFQGLHQRFEQADGREPNLLNPANSPRNSGAQPFESREEVVAAMRTQKYKTDPAERARVEKRLAVTPFM